MTADDFDLTPFCGSDNDEVRTSMMRPQVFAGWRYASSRVMCVRLPTTLPDTINEKFRDEADSHWPRCDKLHWPKGLPMPGEWQPWPTTPPFEKHHECGACGRTYLGVVCFECKGERETYCEHCNNTNECHCCRGIGYLKELESQCEFCRTIRGDKIDPSGPGPFHRGALIGGHTVALPLWKLACGLPNATYRADLHDTITIFKLRFDFGGEALIAAMKEK